MISSPMVYDCAFFAILREMLYDAFSPPSQSTVPGALENVFKLGFMASLLKTFWHSRHIGMFFASTLAIEQSRNVQKYCAATIDVMRCFNCARSLSRGRPPQAAVHNLSFRFVLKSPLPIYMM
ncbi:conserved hypothetical protein [Trichinella spiralis]|uniref:hypothetical protein n=1 Tax=Trichinella spiralis TaxID=6334 RepID=UPI0001EFD607|nr:conserved hypothetical protein [Trichinella spiralis]